MPPDPRELYLALSERATGYGIAVSAAPLGEDEAGEFDGPTITINSDNPTEEQTFFLAHSISSVVRWSVATEESRVIYAELRDAKKHRRRDPKRFEKALDGFCRFEEIASEYAVWLLEDVDSADAVAPYTVFARADLESVLQFHRTGVAPPWREFFARWRDDVTRGAVVIHPYQRRPIPSFQPVKIEKQEIVQEKQ